MRVRLHPTVDSDLSGIREHYEKEAGSEIAAEFYDEFLRQAEMIGERPESFARQNARLRRSNLDRFPYHILFEIMADFTIQILVVKHDHRKPSFGTRRR
jgi:toxin ParE1/3/4